MTDDGFCCLTQAATIVVANKAIAKFLCFMIVLRKMALYVDEVSTGSGSDRV